MGINLDAIRGKLTELQNSTQKNDRIWKPKPGKTTIRIVPYQFNKENPFVEMYFHYDFGKKSYLSPFTYGHPDPVVEFSDQLKKTGDSTDWKLGKKLEPKMRTFVPIIVRGEEDKGVKFWGFGKNIYQELLNIISDADYGDITDLKHGRDVTVEFQKAEDVGNTFGKVSIRIKPNQTPATDDKEIADKIVNGQKELTELFPEPTYDDLKKALQEWLSPKDGDDDSGKSVESTDDEDAPAPKKSATSKPTATAKAAPAKGGKKVADAFDELFEK